MTFKELYDRFMFYLSVPKCVLCHDKLLFSDKGLCSKCREIYESHKSRNCSRCSKILSQCLCTNEYMSSHSIKRHIKIFRYLNNEPSAPGNFLIYSLKRDYRDDVIDFLSDELEDVIRENINDINSDRYMITNVPRRKQGIISYGYDHTEVLAKRLAKKLGIEYFSVLKSLSKKAQKEMRGEDRLHNADFDYKRKVDIELKGKVVILIDDVVTTGASVGACTILLKGLKAKEVIVASIASAYNDKYVKRINVKT